MASIFTYEHDPPRVSSPWNSGLDTDRAPPTSRSVSAGNVLEPSQATGLQVGKLEPEPQEGPIEYKLHLLLRPRRAYTTMSTALSVSGSHTARSAGEPKPAKPSVAPLASSNVSRQLRLEHLTTQLLWRLQQSSPFHSTARSDLVVPRLPIGDGEVTILNKPNRLLPGLEESNGALYEIGVADDGNLIGLTKDEMDESMSTLKIMAASLGCKVEVQRMKAVGTCEWVDSGTESNRREDLWVAEALIIPILNMEVATSGEGDKGFANSAPRSGASRTEQLRVSLTGPTTNGKTTILGTLSNGTLDNGRGSSRINLLKHRHEVASGRTSSVAHELIGYDESKILNYNVDNINEWSDIHDRGGNGRLVFFLDSAGHPRYQRTTLRALVGWAPHWTLLCISAAEERSTNSGAHSISGADLPTGVGITGADLAVAHLDLCLKLEIPLAILITKYELAHKVLFRDKMNSLFTKIKATGRIPKLLTSPALGDHPLSEIPDDNRAKIKAEVIDPISESSNPLKIVPIIITSAVRGMGIGLTHALLQSLPVPPLPTARDFVPMALNPEQPAALFHIDEVFELTLSRSQSSENAPVVTGYLRFGRLSIGDKVVLGPFPADEEDTRSLVPKDHPSPGLGLSIPHPSSAEFARLSANPLTASNVDGEWRNVRIVNIRNLRLPVQTLEAGQAGSMQVVFDESKGGVGEHEGLPVSTGTFASRIRKGQVLAMPSQHMIDTGLSLQASSGFTASFSTSDIKSLSVGSLVNAYVGMVRAAVRVLRIARQRIDSDPRRAATEDDDVFGIHDHMELERSKSEADLDRHILEYHVSLELLSNREWIELGSRVVLLEGGIKDKSGLGGYVGRVIEIAE